MTILDFVKIFYALIITYGFTYGLNLFEKILKNIKV